MYRAEPEVQRPVVRPAGESDEYSDDSDTFDMSGFHKKKKTPYAFQASSNNVQNGSCNGAAATFDDGDDWGTAAPSNVKYTYIQPEPISKCEALRIVCMRGNVDKVKDHLDKDKEDIEINSYFPDNYTPLLTAVGHGRPKLVKFLLEHGANPAQFTRGENKTTPLMAAVACTRALATEDEVLECVKLLVEHKSPINTQGHSSLTALLIAIKRRGDRRKVTEYLLDHGADPDIPDYTGRTALFHAAEVGDGKSCRLLIEKNADVNIIDDSGWSSFDLAADKGFHVLSEFIYKVRTTKWKPGEDPALMQEIGDFVSRSKESLAAEGVTIREDSQIETLLCAINGEKYMKNFRQHKVTYLQFLQFDEDDLKSVGVDEVGIRKKIMESIREHHNTDWTRNSLKMVPVNKKCTTTETVCIINNINFQIEHIRTTLKMLIKRISKDPANLKLGKEKCQVKSIITLLQTFDKNNFALEKEVLNMIQMFKNLENNAELKLGDYFELQPNDFADFIARWDALKENGKQTSWSAVVKNRWFLGVGGVAVVGISVAIAISYNNSRWQLF